jgi:hypothetical protein
VLSWQELRQLRHGRRCFGLEHQLEAGPASRTGVRQRQFDDDLDEKMIALGWPPPVEIRRRNHRIRRALEAFKRKLIEQAITIRKQLAAPVANALCHALGLGFIFGAEDHDSRAVFMLF